MTYLVTSSQHITLKSGRLVHPGQEVSDIEAEESPGLIDRGALTQRSEDPPPPPPYEGLGMDELKAELEQRSIEFSAPPGTSKADLAALLEADDDDKAQKVTDPAASGAKQPASDSMPNKEEQK